MANLVKSEDMVVKIILADPFLEYLAFLHKLRKSESLVVRKSLIFWISEGKIGAIKLSSDLMGVEPITEVTLHNVKAGGGHW